MTRSRVASRFLAGLATLLVGLAATLTIAPGSASAAPVVRYKIQNRATNQCLDSNAQGTVYTLPCNGGGHQYWLKQKPPLNSDVDWGQIWLKNYATGRCLATNSNGDVYTAVCPTKDNRYLAWYTESYPDYIQNQKTSLCIESDGSGWTYARARSWSNNQLWYFW